MQLLDALWHQKPILDIPALPEPILGMLVEADATPASLWLQGQSRSSFRESDFVVYPPEHTPLFPLREMQYETFAPKLMAFIEQVEEERGQPLKFMVWGSMEQLAIGSVSEPEFVMEIVRKIRGFRAQCSQLVLAHIRKQPKDIKGRPVDWMSLEVDDLWQELKGAGYLAGGAENILYLQRADVGMAGGRLVVRGRNMEKIILLTWVPNTIDHPGTDQASIKLAEQNGIWCRAADAPEWVEHWYTDHGSVLTQSS